MCEAAAEASESAEAEEALQEEAAIWREAAKAWRSQVTWCAGCAGAAEPWVAASTKEHPVISDGEGGLVRDSDAEAQDVCEECAAQRRAYPLR